MIRRVDVTGIKLWKEELFCFMGNLSPHHEHITLLCSL